MLLCTHSTHPQDRPVKTHYYRCPLKDEETGELRVDVICKVKLLLKSRAGIQPTNSSFRVTFFNLILWPLDQQFKPMESDVPENNHLPLHSTLQMVCTYFEFTFSKLHLGVLGGGMKLGEGEGLAQGPELVKSRVRFEYSMD